MKEWKRVAKEISNANRTLEKPSDRANIYREMRKEGKSKAEMKQKATELEGNNVQRVLNYSYLSPKGIVQQMLQQFENSGESESGDRIKSIAQWIGYVRSNLGVLTDSHENEL